MAGETQPLRAAVSPCPNDTYIFREAVEGGLTLPGAEISWHFEDVETLNRAAMREEFDITKLSFHAYLAVKERYSLLRAGAALGFGCGPVIVARKPMTREALSKMRIALPGQWTTAHLLFRLYAPEAVNKVFVRYNDILPAIRSGDADAGVIIHEDRFVYRDAGLCAVADLGEWWASETGAPIPLGCIAVKRALADRFAGPLDGMIRESLAARAGDLEGAMPFILGHAQQLEPAVVRRHIDTFVNDFSVDLGEEGDRAVSLLEQMATRAGIIG